MDYIDFDKIVLLPSERKYLRRLRRVGRLPLPREMFHLYKFNLVKQNYSAEVDGFGHPVHDGTYSVSETYARYLEHRHDIQLDRVVIPVIVGSLSATITYLLESQILPRLLRLLLSLW